MWELLNQKAAAQRAVFDKEALYKSVGEVMSEAVSTQMQVAKAVTENEREAVSVQRSAVSGQSSASDYARRSTHHSLATPNLSIPPKSHTSARHNSR